MDILNVIKKEHREVAAMIDDVQACDPGDKRLTELAHKIEEALTIHVKIEERLLYTRLRDRAEDDQKLVDVYEAYTEHDVADHLIHLLKSTRKPDEKFKAELQVLGESVKHHVKEEESTAFSIARQVIDQEERDELGEKWMKAKQRLKSESSKGSSRVPARRKSAASKTSR
jgi:hemerythrin-like domain-containing protein